MKIVGFNHFQLDSKDVDKTRDFYKAFGGKVIRTLERDGGWKGYHVEVVPGIVMEIQPPRFPKEKDGFDGWDHVAMTVGDVDRACKVLVDAGGWIEKQPSANIINGRPAKNAVGFGLDGEKIELIEYTEDVQNRDTLVVGLNHVQLNSNDTKKSKDAYVAAWGGRVSGEIMDRDGVTVKGYMVEIAPGSTIEIQPPRFPLTGYVSSWNTIAVETDDINAAIAQIVAGGFIKEVGPMTNMMGNDKILNAVLIGPGDEHIELIQFTE